MIDASLECLVVCFAHHHDHVADIVIDERLAQRRAVCDGGLIGFPGRVPSGGVRAPVMA